MTAHDPTDDVLAAIASIFDNDQPTAADAADRRREGSRDDAAAPRAPHAAAQDADRASAVPAADVDDATATGPHDDDAIDGYTRLGPGPLDAIRFRWTARRGDDGDYYVDETIGTQSRAMSSGPMAAGDVVGFIARRERAARDRFDRLKDDMTMRTPEQSVARDAVERAHAEYDRSEDQGF